MKQIRPAISGLVACGMVLAMVASLSAQTPQQSVAKVVSIQGSARYMASAGSAWQPLKNGAILKPGAIIQTASASYVDVVLNNPDAAGVPLSAMSMSSSAPPTGAAYKPKTQQDAVRIFENTVLGIDKLMIDQTGAELVTETQLDLKAGRIFGTVRKLTAASKYEVKIPNGVAGIRGTIYYMSADGLLRVMSGSVVLAYVGADGTVITQVVTGGQQFDARTGQLTVIPQNIMGEMLGYANSFRFGPRLPMFVIIPDPTHCFVSQTHARNTSPPPPPPGE
jgi:hypothetical protein